ncbi:LicD family protein [Spirochaeta dissipatitropha]
MEKNKYIGKFCDEFSLFAEENQKVFFILNNDPIVLSLFIYFRELLGENAGIIIADTVDNEIHRTLKTIEAYEKHICTLDDIAINNSKQIVVAAVSGADSRDDIIQEIPHQLQGLRCILLAPVSAVAQDTGPVYPFSENELSELDHTVYPSVFPLKNREREMTGKLDERGIDYCVLRFGPVFSELFSRFFNFTEVDLLAERNLSVSNKDKAEKITITSDYDFSRAVSFLITNGTDGETYNLPGKTISVVHLLTMLLQYSSTDSISVADDHHFNTIKLSGYKLQIGKWKLKSNAIDLIRNYLVQKNTLDNIYLPAQIYDGKLPIIQKLGMKILSEIDRLCAQNNINYFLVCGSALGAYRNNAFIPWDDDIDIGMLRTDLEKFREAVGQMSSDFLYQSYSVNKNCPYIFDKIRCRDTIYSTSYSMKYSEEQGIFLDIFIYDNTFNSRLFQRIHVKLLLLFKTIYKKRLSLTRSKKKKHNVKNKILLLFPLSFYRNIFDFFLTICRNKKNAKFVVDGVGMNLAKGPFPKQMLEDTSVVKFEDMQVNVPGRTEEYLSMLYGKSFMTPPPLSERVPVHKIFQLDLGKYINQKD